MIIYELLGKFGFACSGVTTQNYVPLTVERDSCQFSTLQIGLLVYMFSVKLKIIVEQELGFFGLVVASMVASTLI